MAAPPRPARLISDRPTLSVEAFDTWAQHQIGDTIYEFIAGEVHEVPSNAYASLLAWYISVLIGNFVLEHKLGWLTVADGGFQVGEERYAPDVAFVRHERQRRPERTGYNPIPPDLAIEILSSDQISEHETFQVKIPNYMLANTILLIINPFQQTVQLHVPGLPPQHGDRSAIVQFETLLPGFELRMTDVFDYAQGIDNT